MLFKLFLVFAIIPVIEIAVLIKIGSIIGTVNTVMLVIGTAVVGAYLVKMEGISVVNRFQKSAKQGLLPAEEIFDGAMILVSGALLVTPGIFTDIIGFLLVIPFSRKLIKGILKPYIAKAISSIDINIRRY